MHLLNRLPAAAAALALLVCHASSASAADIVIGVIGELSGWNATIGTQNVRGAQVAADRINESGMLGADKLKLIVEDNASDKGQSLTLLNRMALRDNAAVILGTSSTVLALAIAPRAQELRVPMITPAFTPAVVQGGPWVFKITDVPNNLFLSIAKYSAEVIKPKACARVWARDNEGYVQQSQFWKDYVVKHGVTFPAELSVLNTDTDFTAVATKVANTPVDCLHLALTPETSANFLLQARSLGLPAGTTVIGGVTMATTFFLKAAGKAAEGTYSLADYAPGGMNELGKQFEAAYKKKFNEEADNQAAVGYAEMDLIGHAIKNAGPNPTREAIRNELAKLKDVTSVIGKGTISVTDQIGRYDTNVLVVKDGRFAPAPGN
jgi:branched-chain amino acid transport system substrate-binding protein